MSSFIARLTSPSINDKNWLKTTYKGYNYCILIDGKTGSVLPNCVGYAWGRWRELLGRFHNLSRGNAGIWWGNRADGYARGKTPKLGAVICWSQAGKPGHVAIVEHIKADRTIITSNSGYGNSRFWIQTIKPPYTIKGYNFQGFIYLPAEFSDVSAKGKIYIVQRGDTLSSIAKKYKTTWKNIYDNNKTAVDNEAKKRGIKKQFYNHIWPGQKLSI